MIEVAGAGLLPALLRVALQRHLAPAAPLRRFPLRKLGSWFLARAQNDSSQRGSAASPGLVAKTTRPIKNRVSRCLTGILFQQVCCLSRRGKRPPWRRCWKGRESESAFLAIRQGLTGVCLLGGSHHVAYWCDLWLHRLSSVLFITQQAKPFPELLYGGRVLPKIAGQMGQAKVLRTIVTAAAVHPVRRGLQ